MLKANEKIMIFMRKEGILKGSRFATIIYLKKPRDLNNFMAIAKIYTQNEEDINVWRISMGRQDKEKKN